MSRRDPVRRRSRLRAALLAAGLCAGPARAADPEAARTLMGLAEDRRRMQDAARLLDRMGAPAGVAPAPPAAVAAAPPPPPPPALPPPVVVETPAPIRPPREAQAAVAKPGPAAGTNPPLAAAVPSAAPGKEPASVPIVPRIVPQAAPPPAQIEPPSRVEPVRPQPPVPVAEPARPDVPKPAPSAPAVVAALPERAPGPAIVGRPAQEAAPVRLPAETEVYFGYGSATLSDEAVAALLPLGQDRAGTSAITLLGHADALEKDTQDRKLSERRAEAVRRFLVSSLGFDPRRISLRGLGAERPKVKGDLPSPQNRRVEILPAPAGPAALSPPSPGRPSTDRSSTDRGR
ncbi:OmpA family protein [Methylobacterium sp. sgz302541]|uniref:OmpA family protein n=1 Tax=unclassified Methylobacterium TaxID=2615210 RepID=UPI003D329AAE